MECFKIILFYCNFGQINSALVSMRDKKNILGMESRQHQSSKNIKRFIIKKTIT